MWLISMLMNNLKLPCNKHTAKTFSSSFFTSTKVRKRLSFREIFVKHKREPCKKATSTDREYHDLSKKVEMIITKQAMTFMKDLV